MTLGHYPNDMGLLAIVRMCQTPVAAIPWHSSQKMCNGVRQIDVGYRHAQEKSITRNLRICDTLGHSILLNRVSILVISPLSVTTYLSQSNIRDEERI